MSVFESIQSYYQQRDQGAREWKGAGGKIVGYFCDNVPEELIMAAGFLPYRISGDPYGSTEEADKLEQATDFEIFVKSALNMFLTGRYDFLDFLVIPHARASVHQLYHILGNLKLTDQSPGFPAPYFLENLHTTYLTSEIYNRERYLEFKRQLEEWSGTDITATDLSYAISVYNESRALLKNLAHLRADNPPKVSGVEALTIIGASMFISKEKFNGLLKEYLSGAGGFPKLKGKRLFVEGSPLDNLQLYTLIESCGAVVVGEDNCWGNRYSDSPVNADLDPFEAIVDRYHQKSPCSRIYPMSRRVEYCVKNAMDVKAQGVIFNLFENDAQAWEVPDQTKALNDHGINSLYLTKQPYLISDPNKLESLISEFIRSLP